MGKNIVWALFLILFVVHQDLWWWDDSSLVFGFMPLGLAFHAGFSIACAFLGWLAIRYCWPHDLEAFAEEEADQDQMTSK
jgi:hypothetical protein